MDADATEHCRRLERMYATGAINAFFAPTIRVDDGEAEVRMEVRPDFFHAAHALHGSVYFKVLDDAAYFAASSAVHDVFLLTVSFNVVLIRPVTTGVLTARGLLIHRSANLLVASAELHDHRGKLVATGSGTFARGTTPLSPDIGYR